MKRGRDTERERDKESGCMLNNKNLFASHNSLAESQQGIPHEHKERRERILVLARPIRKTANRQAFTSGGRYGKSLLMHEDVDLVISSLLQAISLGHRR